MRSLVKTSVFFLTLLLVAVLRSEAETPVLPVAGSDDTLKAVEPGNGEKIQTFLTATVSWQYPVREKVSIGGHQFPFWGYERVHLRVFPEQDKGHPIVDVELSENVTRWRFSVLPDQQYVWQLTPEDRNKEYAQNGFERTFVSGSPRIDETTDSSVRYRNPRPGAHFRHMKPLPTAVVEPLSPWYSVSAYTTGSMPTFAELRPKLPRPIYEGHPDADEMYWYAWKTFIEKWNLTPEAADHQAVANINAVGSWGAWGSGVLWDSSAMMFFARYGNQAYPFIQQYDNAYARQHENGFIAMEADKNNHEMYVWYPVVVPPMLSWAEWKYYLISGDLSRLKRVFLPIVKNYEWWMTYMRTADGSYAKQGLTEEERLFNKDDGIMNSPVSANSFQAAEALYLAKIAGAIGRPDMQQFFVAEHKAIGNQVNARYWDETHGIYNDRSDPKHAVLAFSKPEDTGKFITELSAGNLYKSTSIFTPLFAEIVPSERRAPLTKELMNPGSFNRPNGIPNLSADSKGYDPDNGPIGGSWPIEEFMSPEGLKAIGRRDLAKELAEKYFNGFVVTFAKEKTIKESILADKLQFSGAKDFVGWGGIAPIADFIEYVIGLDINVPEKTIAWQIDKTERHGIENLKLGDFLVSLVCAARSSKDEPVKISVNSEGSFDLKLEVHGKSTVKRIDKGATTITVP